jgi:hypothetical protein
MAKRFAPVLLAKFDLEPGAVVIFKLGPPSNPVVSEALDEGEEEGPAKKAGK